MQLKVASYNIRKAVGLDWRRRPGRVLGVLNEIGADIVALQEVDRRFGSRVSALDPELIEKETDYQAINFSHRPQSLGYHGNVILARKSVKVAAARPMALPHLEPRGAAVADLDLGGKFIRIVGMHLGLTKKWRQLQTETIVSELRALEANMPTILMGDLNEPDLKVRRPARVRTASHHRRLRPELSRLDAGLHPRPHHRHPGHRHRRNRRAQIRPQPRSVGSSADLGDGHSAGLAP